MATRTYLLGTLCVAALAMSVCVTPARAQFDEPDTVSRFGVGAFVDLSFRGRRGTSGETKVSFSGGPAFGLRAEYRVVRTVAIAARASYARPEEKLEIGDTRQFSPEGFTELQVAGELLLRVKPSVPGYFVLGGGVRRIDPSSSAVEEDGTPSEQRTTVENFSEPFGLAGVGVELAPQRNWAFRLDFRVYLVSPAEQPYETKGIVTDLALGLGVMYRP